MHSLAQSPSHEADSKRKCIIRTELNCWYPLIYENALEAIARSPKEYAAALEESYPVVFPGATSAGQGPALGSMRDQVCSTWEDTSRLPHERLNNTAFDASKFYINTVNPSHRPLFKPPPSPSDLLCSGCWGTSMPIRKNTQVSLLYRRFEHKANPISP